MTNKYKPVPYVGTSYDELFADGHYEEAIANMQSFLEEQKDNPYAKMIAHINIASCYYYLNKVDAAYEHALLYKQLCIEYGNLQDHYNLYHISALIYEYEQQYEKAIHAIKDSMRIAQQLNLQQELAQSYKLYSHIQLNYGNLQEAIDYAMKAQEIIYTTQADNLYVICKIHCILAAAYIRLDRLAEAFNMIQLLGSNPYINMNSKERSLYLYFQGFLHMKNKQYNNAITAFNESLQIAESCNDTSLLHRLLWDLAHMYEQLQNFETAYNLMRRHSALSHELLMRRSNSKVADVQLNHNIALVQQRANMDPLSGVFNRSYLENTCTEWLQEAKKTKSMVCCLVFDVDNFKTINDTYGHLIGDEVIRRVGQTCNSLLKDVDGFTARFGGDEFVVILRNHTQTETFNKACELFEAICSIQIETEQAPLTLTISMGMICNQSIIANRFTQLFKVADQALYMAKKQGKNQIVSLSNNCSLH